MVELFKSSKQETPTDRILQLKKQGLDNDQIIQTLQREGFKSSQIFDAIQNAEMRESIEGPTSLEGGFSTQNPLPLPISGDLPPPPGRNYSNNNIDISKIEEVAEAIIDEKWQTLVESVHKIVEWKERLETHLVELEKRVNEIHKSLVHVDEATSHKLEGYDKSLSEVKADVTAMNKVLKKVLPDLLEKTRKGEDEEELDDIAHEEDGERKQNSVENKHNDEMFSGTNMSIDDIE